MSRQLARGGGWCRLPSGAYNAAATLAEQLEALAAQRFDGDWELVIVDNGPPVPRIWRGATGSASRSSH